MGESLSRSLSDIDLSPAANDPRPSASCSTEMILIVFVFQRIRLRFYLACGLATGRTSFASSPTAMSDRLLGEIQSVLRRQNRDFMLLPLLHQNRSSEADMGNFRRECLTESSHTDTTLSKITLAGSAKAFVATEECSLGPVMKLPQQATGNSAKKNNPQGATGTEETFYACRFSTTSSDSSGSDSKNERGTVNIRLAKPMSREHVGGSGSGVICATG